MRNMWCSRANKNQKIKKKNRKTRREKQDKNCCKCCKRPDFLQLFFFSFSPKFNNENFRAFERLTNNKIGKQWKRENIITWERTNKNAKYNQNTKLLFSIYLQWNFAIRFVVPIIFHFCFLFLYSLRNRIPKPVLYFSIYKKKRKNTSY